jgi:hypothetical protein
LFGLLLVGAVAAAAVLVLAPLRRPHRETSPDDTGRLELEAERMAAIRALQDLSFDYQVGHLDEREYLALHEEGRRKAIALLKTIDGQAAAGRSWLVPVEPHGERDEGVADPDDLDIQIDRLLRQRRAERQGTRRTPIANVIADVRNEVQDTGVQKRLLQGEDRGATRPGGREAAR